MKRLRIRSALSIVLLATLLLALSGTLYAAGEQFPRAAVLSGGGSSTTGGATFRGAIGQPVAGRVIAGGAQLCSGFLCAPALTSSGDDNTIYGPFLSR